MTTRSVNALQVSSPLHSKPPGIVQSRMHSLTPALTSAQKCPAVQSSSSTQRVPVIPVPAGRHEVKVRIAPIDSWNTAQPMPLGQPDPVVGVQCTVQSVTPAMAPPAPR